MFLLISDLAYMISCQGNYPSPFASVQMVNSKDVDLYIQLLRLWIKENKWEKAFDHSRSIEVKRYFPRSIEWNQTALHLYEVSVRGSGSVRGEWQCERGVAV